MGETAELRGLTFHGVALWGAVLTLGIMAALYLWLSGPTIPDWDGYQQIWDNDGGWLASQGRDPLFVALMRVARGVFGANGYPEFRATLFAGFALAAAGWVYAIRERGVSLLFAIPIVVAVILLKGLVQIREGLAFVLLMSPLVAVFARNRAAWIASGIAVLVASQIHPGAWPFFAVWALSLALYVGPFWILNGPWPRIWATVLAIAVGSAAAVYIHAQARDLEFRLQDLGGDTTVQAIGGVAKYAYWAGLGVVVLMMRREMNLAALGPTKFSYAYATALGSFALPLVYVVCLSLVLSNFYLPAITSALSRLLFSGIEACLVISALRGRAMAAAAIAILVLGVELKLLHDAAPSLFPI